MVKHNNVIPFQHFHKKWARRVKTWLDQPVQKRIRSEKRKIKAAKLAPRPASGALRPLVHCPTQKYNSKIRKGRGFTLEELKVAGINRQFAQTVGIAVDHRRTNKCEESLRLNVERLKEYKSRLIVFPRHLKSIKKGDATKEEIAGVQQIVGEIVSAPKKGDAVTFVKVSEALKGEKGYATLRRARSDARLVGIRLKQSKVVKEDKKEE
jgi:large subunit ribosomal protein L13e